jgi:hypothetical protein
MPSLVKILRRCHSTVREDRNSWAPISRLVRPSRASRAIEVSCVVSRVYVGGEVDRQAQTARGGLLRDVLDQLTRLRLLAAPGRHHHGRDRDGRVPGCLRDQPAFFDQSFRRGQLADHNIGPRQVAERELQRGVGRVGIALGLSRGEQSPRSAAGIGCQQRGAFQERRCRGKPSPGLGPPGRPLEFPRDLLVWPGRGLGPMPRPAIRIGLRIGGLGQRAVYLPAVRQRRRPVGGGTYERMPEPHLGAEHARQLSRRHAQGQFQEGRRVTPCLGHEPVPHARVQRAGQHRVQQRPRVGRP